MRVLVQRFGVRRDGGPQHGLVTSDLAYYETNIKVLVCMLVLVGTGWRNAGLQSGAWEGFFPGGK